MPRTFTVDELYHITTSELEAMSPEDQRAYTHTLIALWQRNYIRSAQGDDEKVGSRESQEWGQ